MINVTVRYDGCERKIDFPCLSEILDSKLKELGVRDLTEARQISITLHNLIQELKL